MVWLQFVICAAVVFFAGTRLARYADVVAEKTGLGRIRVGMLVLGLVTSMPELVTSTSATAIIGDPNLAFGTLVGTCIFNLWLLAVLDGLHRGKPALSQASPRHARSAALGVVLAVVLAVGLLLTKRFPALDLGVIGLPSIAVLVVYAVVTWALTRRKSGERVKKSRVKPVMQDDHIRVEPALWLKLGAAAGVIIAAGIWLSFIGDEIAIETGWGSNFVGSLFLAITTSLPELTVVLASIRMKATDLAVADILGANALDLTYLAANDLVYAGSFYGAVSSGGAIMLGLLVLINLVVIAALLFPRQRKAFGVLSWYSPLIILLYAVGAYLLFISAGA